MSFIDRIKRIFGYGGNKMPDRKPGRNEPCWCGSGLKYKRCHMEADERKHSLSLAATACKVSS